jgi:SAM-dependent methyltransferase
VARVDYTGGAGAYRAARTLPAGVLSRWRAAVTGLALPRGGRVLDVGAGPGGFLDALAGWFEASVVAVEPWAAQRAAAADAGTADRHPNQAAGAESLPVRSGSIDVAWLSTVLHQFDDRDAAVHELGRVVRERGHVLVRGFFGDQEMTGVLADFPGIDRSAATFPVTDDVVASFAGGGFRLERVDDVVEPWRFELDAWVERVRAMRDVDSALRPLTDDEVDAGVQAVIDAHASGDGMIESDLTLRLLTFVRDAAPLAE